MTQMSETAVAVRSWVSPSTPPSGAAAPRVRPRLFRAAASCAIGRPDGRRPNASIEISERSTGIPRHRGVINAYALSEAIMGRPVDLGGRSNPSFFLQGTKLRTASRLEGAR
jgi:hypothetical protein